METDKLRIGSSSSSTSDEDPNITQALRSLDTHITQSNQLLRSILLTLRLLLLSCLIGLGFFLWYVYVVDSMANFVKGFDVQSLNLKVQSLMANPVSYLFSPQTKSNMETFSSGLASVTPASNSTTDWSIIVQRSVLLFNETLNEAEVRLPSAWATLTYLCNNASQFILGLRAFLPNLFPPQNP